LIWRKKNKQIKELEEQIKIYKKQLDAILLKNSSLFSLGTKPTGLSFIDPSGILSDQRFSLLSQEKQLELELSKIKEEYNALTIQLKETKDLLTGSSTLAINIEQELKQVRQDSQNYQIRTERLLTETNKEKKLN